MKGSLLQIPALAIFATLSVAPPVSVASPARQESTQTLLDEKLCGANVYTVVSAAPQGTPTSVAAFLGQWGDGTQFFYKNLAGNLCHALIVTQVKPNGAADALLVFGAQPSLKYMQYPTIKSVHGEIRGDTLKLVDPQVGTYIYTLNGKYLDGQVPWLYIGSSISLPHVR
jgi:hypothetical protein